MPSILKTASPDTLLSVQDLCIDFRLRGGEVRAVHHVSFGVTRGETLGLVGESGCGKSQSLLAAMGLLPSNGRASGNVQYRDQALLGMPIYQLNQIRGSKIAMIFQDPMTALTPHLRIGTQLIETLAAHRKTNRRHATGRALEVLAAVRIPDPKRVFNSFAHELSGGMRQRVMIAIALICEPELLIADEPTTALDVTVQAQILALIDELKTRLNLSVVLVSHNLGIIARHSARVIVMYAGRIVEAASAQDLFASARHPYTQALLRSIPDIDAPITDTLTTIPGHPPQPGEIKAGCAFAPRCPLVEPRCLEESPPLLGEHHAVACHVVNEERGVIASA